VIIGIVMVFFGDGLMNLQVWDGLGDCGVEVEHGGFELNIWYCQVRWLQ
jgi:hypothetical protein